MTRRILFSILLVALLVSSVNAAYVTQLPPAFSSTYVNATTSFSASLRAYNATNNASPLTGSADDDSWLSDFVETNQRFNIDLGSAKNIVRIYYENYHNSGATTDRGAKDFSFWGSNTSGSFDTTTYATDTGWTQLTTNVSQFIQHPASDTADPHYVSVTNPGSYRYYSLKIANGWGTDAIGLRRIELQTSDGEGESDPYDGYVPTSLSGEAPLAVTFTDISYGVPTAWSWALNQTDGNNTWTTFSTSQSPSYTFPEGIYSIRLNASNADGYNISVVTGFITATGEAVAPVANFTATPLTGITPLTVTFTDTSTNNPTSWVWSRKFDGLVSAEYEVFSTEQNPTYQFTYSDRYGGLWSIKLVASNAGGSDSFVMLSQIDVLDAPVAPVADFVPNGVQIGEFRYINITDGTSVHFTEQSTHTPTSWNWSFSNGLGSTYYSNTRHPDYVFNLSTWSPSGGYVKLNATNDYGTGTLIKNISLSAAPVTPIPIFSVVNGNTSESVDYVSSGTPDTTNLSVTAGDTIFFNDDSLNDPTSWIWEINAGNGTLVYSTRQHTSFNYPSDAMTGLYHVKLTVENAAGSASVTKGYLIRLLDSSPPASVSGIVNETGSVAIQWDWMLPTDADFDHVMVWKDGSLFENVSEAGTYWDGLSPATTYQIATKTVDVDGNINSTFVNASATTLGSNWTFTEDGVFTAPIGTTRVVVKMIGGGSSGAGSFTKIPLWSYAGLGGNPGAHETFLMSVTPGETYPIVIGSGGSNKTSTDVNADLAAGNAGGSTSAFGHTVTGGESPLNRYPDAEQSGGNATADGLWSTARLALNGTSDTADGGICGIGYGAPGGGAGGYATTPSYGGRGANGVVIIEDTSNGVSVNLPDFVADKTESAPGTLVHFTDLSTISDPSGLTYNWSFGDGGYSSTSGNVQHVFAYTGSYDVSLTLTTANGSITETKPAYINIVNEPLIVNPPAPQQVTIHVTSGWGTLLSDVNVSVVPISTSLGDYDWVGQMFGIDIGEVPLNSTSMYQTTDSFGSATFLVLPTTKYNFSFSKTGYVIPSLIITPSQSDYWQYATADGAAIGVQPGHSNITVRAVPNKINSTYGHLNISVLDTSESITGGAVEIYGLNATYGGARVLVASIPITSSNFSTTATVPLSTLDETSFTVRTNATSSLEDENVVIDIARSFERSALQLPGIDTNTLMLAGFGIVLLIFLAGTAMTSQLMIVFSGIVGIMLTGLGVFDPMPGGSIAALGSLGLMTGIGVMYLIAEGRRKSI